jgi:hypothetical protein
MGPARRRHGHARRAASPAPRPKGSPSKARGPHLRGELPPAVALIGLQPLLRQPREEQQLGLPHAAAAREDRRLGRQQPADVAAAREAARLLRLQHRAQQARAARHVEALDRRAAQRAPAAAAAEGADQVPQFLQILELAAQLVELRPALGVVEDGERVSMHLAPPRAEPGPGFLSSQAKPSRPSSPPSPGPAPPPGAPICRRPAGTRCRPAAPRGPRKRAPRGRASRRGQSSGSRAPSRGARRRPSRGAGAQSAARASSWRPPARPGGGVCFLGATGRGEPEG